MSEITSILGVSKLENLDKIACYSVDHYILKRLLQGYKIPKVTHIGVDEVYARSPKQQKKGETRDDLFLTVIVDLKTHKAIWVSNSRRKEALDEFFKILGEEAFLELLRTPFFKWCRGGSKSGNQRFKMASIWVQKHGIF